MYFSNIPNIMYDSSNNGNFKVVTNLLRRVKIRAKVKENSVLLDTYDVKDGETPEIIAHKYYGDSQYHWVVLLVNEITDRYHEWPMSEAQFSQYLKDKYSNPSGLPGYFARVCFKNNSSEEAELFGINADAFSSSK